MTQKKQVKQHTSENYISGIILAGGLSTRLGRDKSIEPIENQTLLSRIYQRLLQITNDITVVVNTEEKARKTHNKLNMGCISPREKCIFYCKSALLP